MTGENNRETNLKNDRKNNPAGPRSHPGTVLDRVKMPPMSGDEALRRFHETHLNARRENGHDSVSDEGGELAKLHPIMRLVALGGTLTLIVGGVLGALYLGSRL